jgi:hypothetical protein
MRDLHWHSETLCVTVVSVPAGTVAPEVRGDPTPRKGWLPLARVGFALLAVALPLLATGHGRALLAGVLPRPLRDAVRPKSLVSGGRAAAGLPSGPG